MRSFIRKLPWITEGMTITLVLFFSLEMYELCQILKKPIMFFIVPTAFSILTCMIYRGKEQLAECPELRNYILPVCKPYEWIGSIARQLMNHIPFFKKEYSSTRSVLYPQVSFLPILPINLAVTASIYMCSWDSVSSSVSFIATTFVTFILVGLLSYTTFELSFQIAAIVTLHIKKKFD